MQLTRGRSLARRPSRLQSPKEGRRHAGRMLYGAAVAAHTRTRRAPLPLAREACAQLIGKDVSRMQMAHP